MVKSLGVHTYFGGFAIGVSRVTEVLGSVENWGPALAWAPKLNLRVLSPDAIPRANYVFANPPCSRFSSMSFSKFDDYERTELNSFPEMMDVVDVATAAGAEMVHIESGPLLFSNGHGLAREIQAALPHHPYMTVLKIDTLHAGLPQKRPRTHLFFTTEPMPELNLEPKALPKNLHEFFLKWNAEYEFEPVPSDARANPVVVAAASGDSAVFISARPKILSRYDKYSYSVVSSRKFAWLEENRWLSIDEYAALQGYPSAGFNYAEPGVNLSMALISKSVSPSIAEYLTERVVCPYFSNAPRSAHGALYINLT